MKKLVLYCLIVTGLFAANDEACKFYDNMSMQHLSKAMYYLKNQEFESATINYLLFDDAIVSAITNCNEQHKALMIERKQMVDKVFRRQK
jgi:hypothetical protein